MARTASRVNAHRRAFGRRPVKIGRTAKQYPRIRRGEPVQNDSYRSALLPP